MDLVWTSDLIIFAGIAGVSILLLIVSLLVGELFELGDSFFGDSDGPFFTNSSTVFAFFTTFGATGWLASGQFGMSGIPATGVALIGGIAVGAPIGFMVKTLNSNAGSTQYSLDDFVGQQGFVDLAIPGDSNGRVEVRLPGRGSSVLVARSSNKTPVDAGAVVMIDQIIASVAYVSLPVPEEKPE